MTRRHLRSATLFAAISCAAFVGAGCGPEYPSCDNDEDCHEGEFCVNGQCQQCRESTDCPAGQQCTGGRCEEVPGYCASSTDCPEGQECVDNRCAPSQGYCMSNDDCPEGQECEHNRCVTPGQRAACDVATVYFPFDSSDLSSESRDKLQATTTCMRQHDLTSAQVVGHTDPRGTEEYNLALGERRAQAVLRYLQSLGLSSDSLNATSMGEEMASGTNDATWSRDRRADVLPR